MQDPIVEPHDVVSVLDPALDRERMDVERYAETREASLIVAKPGMTPVIFRVAPLTASQFAHLDSDQNVGRKVIAAFSFAVQEIRNWPHVGVSTRPDLTVPNGRGGEMRIWNDDAIEQVRREMSLAVIYEIGFFAYERSLISGNAWGGAWLRYTLPQSSRDVLDRMQRHAAASIRIARAMQTSAPPEQPSAPTSAPTSAAPTGATAEASATTGDGSA